MKKKLAFSVLGLSLAASVVVGTSTFAEKENDSDSTLGMIEMMDDAMNSEEGKEMIKSCNEFMESYEDEKSPSDSKDSDLKSKEASTAL